MKQVALTDLLDNVERTGYCVVENFAERTTEISANDEHFGSMRFLELHPPKQKFQPVQLDCASWRKLAVGSRNELPGMKNDYGLNLETDHFWNACRIHHLPQGGGHMSAHRDTHVSQHAGKV